MAQYRSFDGFKGEIRLLAFESTSEDEPVRLNLHYVSLHDWKPEYTVFRDQNTSANKSQLAEAWSDRLEFTPVTPLHEIRDFITRFIWGDYICLSYIYRDRDS